MKRDSHALLSLILHVTCKPQASSTSVPPANLAETTADQHVLPISCSLRDTYLTTASSNGKHISACPAQRKGLLRPLAQVCSNCLQRGPQRHLQPRFSSRKTDPRQHIRPERSRIAPTRQPPDPLRDVASLLQLQRLPCHHRRCHDPWSHALVQWYERRISQGHPKLHAGLRAK